MFCFQCEQTALGKGCEKVGVCGKDETTAKMQDLLLYVTKGISMYAHRARKLGKSDQEIDKGVVENLFTTVTNVNFDAERISFLVRRALDLREKAKKIYEKACTEKGIPTEKLTGPATWTSSLDMNSLAKEAGLIGITERMKRYGADITGLQELLTSGLKGTAAYADHASILGKQDDSVYAFFHEHLDLLTNEKPTVDMLFKGAMRTGEVNIKVMELLDAGNTEKYGHPEPTSVRVTPIKGKAILVSGHDLVDLEALLKQTEGKGINVYTHGEMLPCNAYPGLKKYKHLVGNYGSAWQNQATEFDAFPGAILMTTNCIQRPRDTYKSRIFTAGLVGWPGVTHVAEKNFKPVIDAALSASGFANDEPEKRITIGFGRNAVLSVAGKVIEAVKSGAIKHFFLVGGCDGAKSGRNYYTEFVEKAPKDTVILTLACGKYRFNNLELGDIGGIPRLLDVGQCNDAYSAIQIAAALAKAFNTDVNGLPLSLVLSWYEQKAVCILLSLLSLGIKNIRLGPTLPACVTPAVLNVLVEKFAIAPISTPQNDLNTILKINA
ncbi:MAG: hydroxylamine reductase [Candidatus Riflebacteria bacterium]|nr:hydroxylamine reductase [Candidatus Riflebacteria bacterium]